MLRMFRFFHTIKDVFSGLIEGLFSFFSVFPPWLVGLMSYVFVVLIFILVLHICKTLLEALPLV